MTKISCGGDMSICLTGSLRLPLGENLIPALNSPAYYPDVELIFDDKSILLCHACILASRSSRFFSELSSLKKQNPHHEILRYFIPETNSKIFLKFLNHLYADYIDYANLDEIITLGIQYNVQRLITYKDFLNGKLPRVPDSTLAQDFLTGLSPDGEITALFGNVTFQLSKEEIKSHKVFLYTRSDYFRAMFERKMIESQKNVIRIGDENDSISAEAVKSMLQFIYCDTLQTDVNNAIELLALSSQYNLNRCMDLCENIVMKNVETDTVVYVLQLAKLHHSKRLISFCISLIKSQLEVVKKSDYWIQLSPDEKEEITEMIKK